MNQVSAEVKKLETLNIKMKLEGEFNNWHTHFDWAIIALRNRFRFQVTLQISIKVILKEFLQGLPITAALNIPNA